MRAPLLQTAWQNRPAFDPASGRNHYESFWVKLNDPDRRRALWTRITLMSGADGSFAETWAIWFDPDKGPPRAVKERIPIDRVRLDPERGGVGAGTCATEDGQIYGVVRGDDLAISWDFETTDELPPYQHLPSRFLYESKMVGGKIVSPHPSMRARGTIELWEGLGPHSAVERIDVDGWWGMQGHHWGHRHAVRHAWVHCNILEESGGRLERSFFEAFAAIVRIAGIKTPVITLGRLVVEGRTYQFDRWANLFAGNRSEVAPTRWSFELKGPDGHLNGVAEGVAAETVGLVYANPKGPISHCLNSKLANLQLTLKEKSGAERVLKSNAAALEVVQHETDHGITMVL